MLEAGQSAPSFSLPSTSGRTVSLAGLRGKKTVLYFYPKDDTPGCTREACAFRDNMARLHGVGAQVFGVSKDSLAAHAKFREKYSLPFELLTDADNAVAKKYGAYGKKMMYGKEVQGTIRSTFLIDERGRLERVWSPVRVDGHVDQVLEALQGDSQRGVKPSAKKKAATRSTATSRAPAKASAPGKAAAPAKKRRSSASARRVAK